MYTVQRMIDKSDTDAARLMVIKELAEAAVDVLVSMRLSDDQFLHYLTEGTRYMIEGTEELVTRNRFTAAETLRIPPKV